MNKEFIALLREYVFLIESRQCDGTPKSDRLREDLHKMRSICTASERGQYWVQGKLYYGAGINHCVERLIAWWRDRGVQRETIELIEADYLEAQKEVAEIRRRRQAGEKINFAALVKSMASPDTSQQNKLEVK